MEDLQARKRKQVKNACGKPFGMLRCAVNCQKACKKCDEARPCSRCVKYGLAASCVDSVRKERKKGLKRGPYKRKTSRAESFLAPPSHHNPFLAAAAALEGYGYAQQAGGGFFNGYGEHMLPIDLPAISQTPGGSSDSEDAAEGERGAGSFYSDDELSTSGKLDVLASLCSAVLDHSRNPSGMGKVRLPAVVEHSQSPFFKKLLVETQLPLVDREALDALSAPIASHPPPGPPTSGINTPMTAFSSAMNSPALQMRPGLPGNIVHVISSAPMGGHSTHMRSFTEESGSALFPGHHPSARHVAVSAGGTPTLISRASTPYGIVAVEGFPMVGPHYTGLPLTQKDAQMIQQQQQQQTMHFSSIPILPHQHQFANIIISSQQQPLTPPRSVADIKSYPQTPQPKVLSLPPAGSTELNQSCSIDHQIAQESK